MSNIKLETRGISLIVESDIACYVEALYLISTAIPEATYLVYAVGNSEGGKVIPHSWDTVAWSKILGRQSGWTDTGAGE